MLTWTAYTLKIKKSSNEAQDIDSDLITLNNVSGHLVKEISVTKYESNKELTPTFSTYEIYQYSDAMLKHLPKDSLKRIEKTMLYSKEPVYLNKTSLNRRVHDGSQDGTTGTTAQIAARKAHDAKDLNIGNRTSKFQNQLKNEYVYRIPLRYFTD